MSFQTVKEVFLRTCEHADTPYSLGLWLRLKYSDALFDVSFDPKNYNDVSAFDKDYTCYNLLRKYKGFKTKIDTRAVAFDKFITSERLCASTNKRLKNPEGYTPRQSSIFHVAQRKISEILGPFSLVKVLRHCGWSPGASTDLPRRRSFVDTKISQVPFDVTARALPYARLELEHDPDWFFAITGLRPSGPYSILPCCFSIKKSNRLTVVPKDSSTDRVIAIEPRLNMFLQKGVGSYIRGKLKKFRIDLDNQSINQELSRIAFRESLSTIDLSSASDTVASELIAQLLPVDWFNYMDDLRSHYGVLPDGKTIHYEKFSSMGNGFTFELESLIFYAISFAVAELDSIDWQTRHFLPFISVYGDDIIAPQEMYTSLSEALLFSGFLVNNGKSYKEGYFFESCGKHYFKGIDVTPVYQKEELDDREAVRMYNRLLRKFRNQIDFEFLREGSIYRHILIPDFEEADDGFIAPIDRFNFSKNGVARIRVIKEISRELPADESSFYAYALRKMHLRTHLLRSYENFRSRFGDLLMLDATDGRQIVQQGSGRYTTGHRNVFLR